MRLEGSHLSIEVCAAAQVSRAGHYRYLYEHTLRQGFFDTYDDRVHLLVTGSSRLDIFRRGGGSLMGRYLLYRMHPWSVGKCNRAGLLASEIRPAKEIMTDDWEVIWDHGGFPEPILRREARFTRRWRSLRQAHALRRRRFAQNRQQR